ncbi:MAG: NUDIX hydrolase [Chloroflexi bacterium]|nr:NUDIX hydrolase [Chloroflexota bacterium]
METYSSTLPLNGANPWTTIESRVIWESDRLRLRDDRVLQPDGAPGQYTFVEIPNAVVAVVVMDDDGFTYLVRQWRYPWGCNSWEIPAGHAEGGESPLDAARRELAEEVGLQAREWETLGIGHSSAVVAADYHLFLARGLDRAADAFHRDGAEEDMRVARVPLAVAVDAAMDSTITHAFSVVGLLRAARRLKV